VSKKGIVVIGFRESAIFGRAIARGLQVPYKQIIYNKFPDQESYLRLPMPLKGKNLIFVSSLYHPNEKLIPLIFSLYTAKQLNAKKNILVAPYLSYLRQDKAFHSGECVSSKALAHLFKGIVDRLYTVNPHLHRISRLGKLFTFPSTNIQSIDIISSYISTHFSDPLILGPDKESSQWVNTIGARTGFNTLILLKKRYSSHHVVLTIDRHAFQKIPKKQEIIVFDDIISSGSTMIKTVAHLKKFGYHNISVICVHGVFAEQSYKKLKKIGVKKIVSTNTIPHHTNKINIIPAIIKQLKKDLII